MRLERNSAVEFAKGMPPYFGENAREHEHFASIQTFSGDQRPIAAKPLTVPAISRALSRAVPCCPGESSPDSASRIAAPVSPCMSP